MTDACIGLGSNLGESLRILIAAGTAIGNLPETAVTKRSAIYASEPIGPGTQNRYLNAAIRIDTSLDPRALLEALQTIEIDSGRIRGERWGPRTLDLDILLYGGESIAETDLEIPHPRIRERNFVLAPLRDLLGPDTEIFGAKLADLLASAPDNGLETTDLTWTLATQRDCA